MLIRPFSFPTETRASHITPQIARSGGIETPRRRVVILGGGFGGLAVARGLSDAPADVTLIDRRNHHLFQPLLYQVATAGLSPADIAAPIRDVISGQENARVLMAEVTGIDTATKTVRLNGTEIPYDDLVVATGAKTDYHAHPEWENFAPGLKTVEDATAMRRKILSAFERAELEPDEEKRRERLRFVIVGGGPTGVELAGALAELSGRVLTPDFRVVKPGDASVILMNAGPRILSAMPEDLAEKARLALERLGVEVLLNAEVRDIDADGVTLKDRVVKTHNVLWAAGVKAGPAAEWLGVSANKGGRVAVDRHCRVPGLENVYVIGDAAIQEGEDGKPLPGLAAVAKQQGEYVARSIRKYLSGGTPGPFRYADKGVMSVIGRSYAVAELGKIKSAGFMTWLTWWFVHIAYLTGFRNKASVFLQWAWSYLTFGRGARLITNEMPGKNPADK